LYYNGQRLEAGRASGRFPESRRADMPVYIGLATTFHDPAIAIVGPRGEIRFAEASERYLQYKRAPGCEPDLAARMCELLRAHVEPDEDVVVATTWSDRFQGYLAELSARGLIGLEAGRCASRELAASLVPEHLRRAMLGLLDGHQRQAGIGVFLGLHEAFGHGRMSLRRYPHHLTHAALACFTSPFAEAACLVVDGMGERGAAASWRYAGGRLEPVREYGGAESLGFFYGLMTELCGFDPARGEEWKVMGLAPYGRPDRDWEAAIARLYRIENGEIRFASVPEMRAAVRALRRRCEALPKGWQAHADLAHEAQRAFAAMMNAYLAQVAQSGGSTNLAFAGGCALNSSFNGRIVGSAGFERLYVPPAPADDGNALGAALLAYHEDHPHERPRPGFLSPYLGTPIATGPVERLARHGGARARHLPGRVHEAAAELLIAGKVIGWARGRAEFGPRALGNRSILADPRAPAAKDRVNAKVKLREPFRPFAPSILHEHGPAWFEDYQESPYMERTLVWRPDVRARVPGVVHADETGRLQSVRREANPVYYDLIAAFHAKTGVPAILNTSFNIMGKPIIHSAEDAVAMLYTTGIDAIVIEDWLVEK
jgi:carbamoyltransferase